MQAHRRIPYGVMNWEKVVRECHFVDNTGYIRELEMNENFFRTTFASRTWDAVPMYYSIEIEYNWFAVG